jgi:prophage regulatory protein
MNNKQWPDNLLSFKQVLEMVPLSRQTIHRLRKSGNFPQPIRIGLRRVYWYEYDIASWYANLKRTGKDHE